MIWNRKKTTQQKRSEEIQDIIDRMPTSFGRWVGAAVCVFFILLMLFGWLIRYPDSVTGQIKINSDNVPVKLVAGSSGKITIFGLSPQDSIKENEYIAVIQNSANTDDIRMIKDILDRFNPTDKPELQNEILFPDKVSLGELNLKYYTFLSSLKTVLDYKTVNSFEKQKKSISDDILWKENLLKEIDSLENTTAKKLAIALKWYDKYTELQNRSGNPDLSVIHEYETDMSKTDYLSSLQSKQNINRDRLSLQMQIENDRNSLERLGVDQYEKERQIHLDLLSAYYDLKDNLKTWEQRYVFKAPFEGQVEFLKFLANSQFIQSGEEVFGIVPREKKILGQMLLPARGAGKVKLGSRVVIQLDDYPYLEYGAVEGVVGAISLITNQQKLELNIINTYLVSVELPQGLKTNYGELLDFKYEISGQANIIVKERRLIERLFDNLKYRTR